MCQPKHVTDTTFSARIFAKSWMIVHQLKYDLFESLYRYQEYYVVVLYIVILNMYYFMLNEQHNYID